ncbi:hypothetical protein [Tunturiibacter gelidiferens]|uniref:hypothetical protein n=1 Tax=Tunturiibacter gelidiferens TaxID=3069689 RepID=UPI003D9BE427
MRKSFLFVFAFMAATTLCARAAQSDSMDCGEFDKPITTHDYTSAPSDTLQPHHLEFARPFAPSGRLKLHICRADLRVNVRPDTREIKLTVNLNTQSGSYTVANYVQTFRIQPDNGVIQLKFPKAAHATVTVTLPMGLNSDNEINLGYGDLDFNATGSSGHREINLGMGHMQLVLNKDKSYSKMEVNVGLGTLHDHRPGGSDGHFTTTKEYAGTGAGSLEINVGMGSLDIRNE